MTYQEFLKALEQTPRDWRIEAHQWIRRGNGLNIQCPLMSVGVGYSAGYDMDLINQEQIMRAADGFSNGVVRADILRACGLTEQS